MKIKIIILSLLFNFIQSSQERLYHAVTDRNYNQIEHVLKFERYTEGEFNKSLNYINKFIEEKKKPFVAYKSVKGFSKILLGLLTFISSVRLTKHYKLNRHDGDMIGFIFTSISGAYIFIQGINDLRKPYHPDYLAGLAIKDLLLQYQNQVMK